MAEKHDLEHLVRQATSNMLAEYERMRKLAREDPGTSGDQGEENWAELIAKWLPATFHVVTKGRIISSTGQTSGQVDVLVLSPSYPMGLISNKLYMAAGVVAAFECKRTLRREHIKKAVQASAKLARLVHADFYAPHLIPFGLLAHSYQFSSTRKTPIRVVVEALKQAEDQVVSDPREMLDIICVPGLGTWNLGLYISEDEKPGEKKHFAALRMGPIDEEGYNNDDAIGTFLVHLLRRIGRIDESVTPIARYLNAPDVGLFTGLQANGRNWHVDEIPEILRTLAWNWGD